MRSLIPIAFASLCCLGLIQTLQGQTDAKLPEGQRLFWGEEPVEVDSAARATICLNGLWKFLPAVGSAESGADTGWGYIRVPGSWQSLYYLPGVVAAGRGDAWQDFGDGKELAKAWYRRRIRIPAEWQGRAVLLRLQRVSTDATVYVNGQECGRIEWPAGTVDITDAVTPGDEADLNLLVVAVADAGQVTRFMGPNQSYKAEAKLSTRGIIGDVLLESRPPTSFVSDVFVQPSTRLKRVAVDVELSGVARPGTVDIVGEMLDESGRVERRFTAQRDVVTSDIQTLRVEWPWSEPRLWDLDVPNLYTLRLSVTGAGMNDVYAQGFGFREFWIEGRRYFLNGREFRMRPCTSHAERYLGGTIELIDAQIDGLRGVGYNLQEVWPKDHDERGFEHYRELWYDRADRKGWPVMGTALSMTQYINTWAKDGVKSRWESRMLAELKRIRNHPSIAMWATSANRFGHGNDQDPRVMGRKHEQDDDGWRKRAATGEDAVATIKKHDPSRAVLVHAGGPVGDVYAPNCYLNMLPLQDREEWISQWVEDGDMPICLVEFGTPLFCTVMRGHEGGGWGRWTGATYSEPLLAEFAAIYFGERAYQMETADYRAAIRGKHSEGDLWESWQNEPILSFSPLMQEIEQLFVRNTWRSWRAQGPAAMIPWGYADGWDTWGINWRRRTGKEDVFEALAPFQPGRRGTWTETVHARFLTCFQDKYADRFPAADMLEAVSRETLAWIGGPPGNVTAKDHSFRPGCTVTKQLVLINDYRSEQSYEYEWTARVGDAVVGTGKDGGRLEGPQTLNVPIQFVLPDLAGDKANGQVELRAQIAGVEHSDLFRFRVFGAPGLPEGALTICDPVGETRAALESLGLSVEAWDGSSVVPLLVVGRRVLDSGKLSMDSLRAFVEGGGDAVVCGQDPDWMRGRGMRASRHITRRVYPVDSRHPVMAGLDAEDLRDWTGESSLIEPKPVYEKGKIAWRCPTYGWRWGARGAVASAAVEKPHHGGWRPILQCEFDLAYSPLMELDVGRGRLLWCMLDFEDHVAQDPAAARLALNMLAYASRKREAMLVPRTAVVGGEETRDRMDRLGVIYDSATALDHTAALAVVGPDAAVDDDAIRAYLAAGGRCLFLSRAGGSAPLGVTLSEQEYFDGATSTPDWDVCAGLSISDLRWRTSHPAWTIKTGCDIGADGLLGHLRVGKGVAVFCQVDPDRFDTKKEPFFRYTRWRQTRVLSQLLANLGARLTADQMVFTPAAPARSVSLDGKWRARIVSRFPDADSPKGRVATDISAEARRLVVRDLDDADWGVYSVPRTWESFGPDWKTLDGEVVFRTVVSIPESWIGKDLELRLGKLYDLDATFFNGEEVGSSRDYQAPRVYAVPGRLVTGTENVLAIRLLDMWGGGGFGARRGEMTVRCKEPPHGLYCGDFRTDFPYGDDPYRYYRW